MDWDSYYGAGRLLMGRPQRTHSVLLTRGECVECQFAIIIMLLLNVCLHFSVNMSAAASYVAVLWCPLDVWWCTSIILSSMCDVAMRKSESDSSDREENPTVIIIIIKVGSFPFACLVVWIMCYVDVTVYSGSYKCMRDCIIFLQTNESA